MQTTSIDKFPLKWRWTEADYCLLPPDELAQISPLAQADANEMWSESLKLASGSTDFSPNTKLFRDIERIEARNDDEVRSWLSMRLPHGAIIVSWQPDLAVLTNTQLFIKYWSSFCYAASDDASIMPIDKSWVVHYWHEEVIWFGKSVSV